METRKRNLSFESVLVMILLIIFAVSACIMIIQGSQSYNTILSDKEKTENARIALSYINMRVKQNDESGKIDLEKGVVDSYDALVVRHSGDEEGMVTYIYFAEGALWECYTDSATLPTQALSSQIVPLDDMILESAGDTLHVTIKYTYGKQQLKLDSVIALRSATI